MKVRKGSIALCCVVTAALMCAAIVGCIKIMGKKPLILTEPSGKPDSKPDTAATDTEKLRSTVESQSATSASSKTVTTKAVTTTTAVTTTKATSTKAVTTTTPAKEVYAAVTVSFPLEINHAQLWELTEIPGVGEKTAQNIISYREQTGIISDLEMLLEVNGIGRKTLDSISPYLYVGEEYQLVYEEPREEDPQQEPEYQETEYQETETETQTAPTETFTEPPAETPPPETTQKQRQPVDINYASAQELEEKLLITPEMAQEIVKLRQKIKFFVNSLELLYAPGMTNECFNEIKDYLLITPTE